MFKKLKEKVDTINALNRERASAFKSLKPQLVKKWTCTYIGGHPELLKKKVCKLAASNEGLHVISGGMLFLSMPWSQIIEIRSSVQPSGNAASGAMTTAGLVTGDRSMLAAGAMTHKRDKQYLYIDIRLDDSSYSLLFESAKSIERAAQIGSLRPRGT